MAEKTKRTLCVQITGEAEISVIHVVFIKVLDINKE